MVDNCLNALTISYYNFILLVKHDFLQGIFQQVDRSDATSRCLGIVFCLEENATVCFCFGRYKLQQQ